MRWKVRRKDASISINTRGFGWFPSGVYDYQTENEKFILAVGGNQIKIKPFWAILNKWEQSVQGTFPVCLFIHSPSDIFLDYPLPTQTDKLYITLSATFTEDLTDLDENTPSPSHAVVQIKEMKADSELCLATVEGVAGAGAFTQDMIKFEETDFAGLDVFFAKLMNGILALQMGLDYCLSKVRQLERLHGIF